MAKEATFDVFGKVLEIKPNEQFIVEVNLNGQKQKIIASIAGSIRRFRIRIAQGDTVKVCMTHYDLTKGRITFREKEPNLGLTNATNSNINKNIKV